MRSYCLIGKLMPLSTLAAVLLLPAALIGSDRIKGVREYCSHDETVEVFSGIESGKLEVKLIPKDSTECRVLIKNKTDKPLNVSLPDVFAGVPVLAQVFGDNLGMGDRATNTAQQLGIGNPFGSNAHGIQGNQFFNVPGWGNNVGPGFAPFNVAPEKVAQLRLASVCLNPGKPDPRPRMAYEIKPIESVTTRPEVQELCRMLGRGQVAQRPAQAAAWHLNNGLSWRQLAALRVRISFGPLARPLFTPRALAVAKKAAENATRLARDREHSDQTSSLSMR
jgi:hypothetical protein